MRRKRRRRRRERRGRGREEGRGRVARTSDPPTSSRDVWTGGRGVVVIKPFYSCGLTACLCYQQLDVL